MNYKFAAALYCVLATTSEATEVRMAILDNLQAQKLSSEAYEKSYFTGIEAARKYAKARGITLTHRHFEYNRGELDILEKLKDLKKWDPHFVIGPRSSGKLLMLRESLADTLTISPLATATEVALMPSNFYSITPDNQRSASYMAKFIKRKFKKHRIIAFTELECKSCNDYTKQLAKELGSQLLHKALLTSEIESIDSKELSSEIQKNDVILLSATSYGSSVLLHKIANRFHPQTRTFLGNDEWGSFKSSFVGKIPMEADFVAYRIVPWSLKLKEQRTEEFFQYALKTDPSSIDEISFISFSAVKSVIDAISISSSAPISKQGIIRRFLQKVKENRDYSRPTSFSIIIRSKKGEKFLEAIH